MDILDTKMPFHSHIEKKSASQQENMKIKNDFFYQKSIISTDFFCFLLKRKSIPQKLFVKYLPVATQTRDTRPSELEQWLGENIKAIIFPINSHFGGQLGTDDVFNFR